MRRSYDVAIGIFDQIPMSSSSPLQGSPSNGSPCANPLRMLANVVGPGQTRAFRACFAASVSKSIA